MGVKRERLAFGTAWHAPTPHAVSITHEAVRDFAAIPMVTTTIRHRDLMDRSAASSWSGPSGVMIGLTGRPASITKPIDFRRRPGSRLNQ